MVNKYLGRDLKKEGLQVCKRCIYDETISNISFDEYGICNYCKLVEDLSLQYGTGTDSGKSKFDTIVEEIKKSGKGKKYDVAVGVSGGTDSSYMLYLAKKYGLRPLAVHYDNTWNTAIATENIRKVTSKLEVDLYTHVCDNKESDDIFLSFFKASVPEIDGPTDIALAEVMYRAAAKYNIKYVFEGHSFIAEGVSPLSKAYVDGGYIKSVHKKFGKLKMKTFPNMTFWKFLYWTVFKRIRKIRPLWYLQYSKEDARAFLENEFDWVYYGGHHLENRMTAFHHSYYTPNKFQLDQRNNSLSASVRSGKMSREEALKEYASKPILEDSLLDYFKERMGLSDQDFIEIMNRPPKTYKDFKTYKHKFERWKPLFKILANKNLVPMSFYLKYCNKSEMA
ncbi:N-acetyl sugar amidotransferase [Roseivirga sp. UBA838]|uniref:N-acetyl sugar amidotransferase n=1 Tax=Roseivirga sp. UBA838 TaxID=1947393 RepID=UPI00257C9571|nr:N-acetyl sugar amidotransferase [Roseivirga sp. UBA838]|tara:strand:- start:45820 stop:47001 length:1182 start_codon:yes stop_codon:yes gene_type:complete